MTPDQRARLEEAAKQDVCNNCKFAALEILRIDRSGSVPEGNPYLLEVLNRWETCPTRDERKQWP